jgi:LSD1 subclass zinc finger protein
MQKMVYLLVSQHVSGVIMPITTRKVQNRQRLWCTALAVLQYTRGEEVVRCCTPQALSVLYLSRDDGHDDARNMLRHQ